MSIPTDPSLADQSLADQTIAALRTEHEALVAFVPTLTDEQLVGPSGASEWSVAQVLSHLGSGSEIGLATLRAAADDTAAPDNSFNRSVWDRWDAMTPADQRAGFLEHNARLVEAFEALTPEQRGALTVNVGFAPAPLSVAGFAGMRLNEVSHHSWDARVGVDPTATLVDSSAPVLVEQLTGEMSFFLGFLGKVDKVAEPAVVAVGDTGTSIVIDDRVSLGRSADEPTARFSGAPEAALRLIFGRLAPQYTPADVSVSGNLTLDDLREVFPGL